MLCFVTRLAIGHILHLILLLVGHPRTSRNRRHAYPGIIWPDGRSGFSSAKLAVKLRRHHGKIRPGNVGRFRPATKATIQRSHQRGP